MAYADFAFSQQIVSHHYDNGEYCLSLGLSADRKQFPYFSTKTYVVGTQKNRPNVTVLLKT